MSNAELFAKARRAFNEWYGSPKSEAEAGSRSHEWVRQYANELLAALESQPEQTANVDDRDALMQVIAEWTFPASSIADAILAAGFSRAQDKEHKC